jgi:hypothetical protein
MKQLPRQVKLTLTLLAFVIHSLMANSFWVQTSNRASAQSALTNSSFESGTFAGFTPLDQLSSNGGPPPPPPIDEVVSILGAQSDGVGMSVTGNSQKNNPLTLAPTDGNFFAIVNTVRDVYRLRQSVLIQESFPITLSGARLLVDLDFLTNEFNTGPATNDTAAVFLTINETGQVIPLAFFTRDQLQLGGAGEPGPQAVRNAGGFQLSSGWKTYEVDLRKYVGKSGFLTFSVRKAVPLLGFEAQNSALAIDSIKLVN